MTDELVCPVVECRAKIEDRDLLALMGADVVSQRDAVLQRKRVRWRLDFGCAG